MRLKRLETYLASLPAGLDSFAGHVQKASVYRELIAGVDLAGHVAELPAPLAALVVNQLPLTSWVPEVHACALFMAMADLHFSDAGFLQHMYKANRALLSGAVYGMLFRLLGPKTIMKGARSRWGQLHRGMTMVVVNEGQDQPRAAVQLDFPDGMVPELALRSYAEAFRAALEVAGAAECVVDFLADGPGRGFYSARWK